MKIKLSKTQWEEMGKKSGWMKQAQLVTPVGTGGPFGTPVQAPAQAAPAQAAPAQAQQPAAAPQQAAPNAKGWTFSRLMQDPSFKSTFDTIKKQRQNEKQILQYWQKMGIQYKSIPEILEVIGTDTI